MRSIPIDVKQKLLQNIQSKSNDANPNLRILATQSTVNTLLTEIIHKDTTAAFGDVAIRQLEGEKEPSLAYAICVDNGKANIYERPFPTYTDTPWRLVWSVDEAVSDVAIEFDGFWGTDINNQWHYLQTENIPYVFLVIDSVLYVQKWNDSSSRVLLAENVSNISACRGWQSSDDILQDQGLIVGYIRDNAVFYRSFCTNESFEKVWEPERSVLSLGANNKTLCLFRTNDFRVGFLAENTEGRIQYVLSDRTYAGQSIKPESVYSQVVQECSIAVYQIKYQDIVHEASSDLIVQFTNNYIANFMTIENFTVVSTTRQGLNEFVITTSHTLEEKQPLIDYLEVVTSLGAKINISSVTVTDKTIRVITASEITLQNGVNINLKDNSNLRYLPKNSTPFMVPSFSAVFPPEAVIVDEPQLNVLLVVNKLNNIQIYFPVQNSSEEFNVNFSYLCTLKATMVGSVPV